MAELSIEGRRVSYFECGSRIAKRVKSAFSY